MNKQKSAKFLILGMHVFRKFEHDQEIPQLQTADKPNASRGRVTQQSRDQEDKLSKATSSLFPIKMIEKLEWAQSNAQQNIEQLPDPTKGEAYQQRINNNRTTTLEWTAAEPLKCIYCY